MEKLNDLSGTEWLPATRSAFVDNIDDPRSVLTWDKIEVSSVSVLSTATPRSAEKKHHPATFSESDAKRLVRLFTREGDRVLDPFIGSGSTALACIDERRSCLGFELYDKWAKIAKERVASEEHSLFSESPSVEIYTMEALEGLRQLPDSSQDFIVTSPPYWGILSKKDHKAKRERQGFGLDTDYGEDSNDLAQIHSYDDFLEALACHFEQWYRVLVARRYAAVIVSDFRHGQKYYPFHAHIAEHMEQSGFTIQGMIVIVQDNKQLYPYGYPTTYVPNICNQFVIVGRKI